MYTCLIFSDEIVLHKLPLDFLSFEYIDFNGEPYYFNNSLPAGFELGFYNWVIENDNVVGVSIKFNEDFESFFLDFFSERKYSNCQIGQNNITIFFKNYDEEQVWEDESENFSGFYSLCSESGNIGLTFECR